jgi:hypothetical protein
MKRLLVLALLALGLTILVVPTAAPAPGGDAKGPPCANITFGEATYNDAGTAVTFDAFLQKPACSFVTYSFFVTSTTSEVPLPASSVTQDTTSCTPQNPGEGCVHFEYTLASTGPAVVCFYTTTEIHGHLVDRAPNLSQPTCPASSPSHSVGIGESAAAGGFD